jgi:CHASE2 domain-containing sensor protein
MTPRWQWLHKLTRSIFPKTPQHREPRGGTRFAALVVEMVSHNIIRGVMTTLIGSILGFTIFGGMFLDIYNNLAPPIKDSGEVTLVTISHEALYLWDTEHPNPVTTPRDMLAQLVSLLDEAGAKTIVLDVLLDSPQDGDDALATAALTHGAVIGAEQTIINQPRTGRLFSKGITPTLRGQEAPIIFPAQANLFFTEPILFTGELIFRGVHLVQHYQRSSIVGQWPDTIIGAREEVFSPSLSLAAAWLHQARKNDPEAHFHQLLHEIKEQCTTVEGDILCSGQSVSHLPDFPSKLHQDFWLHHMGSEHNDYLPFVPASTLLMLAAEHETFKRLGIPEDQLPPTPFPEDVLAKLKDKLVIVGRVDIASTGHEDRYPTSYSFPLFKNKDMAGVRIQAQLIDAILSGRSLVILSGWWQWLLSIGFIWVTVVIHRRTHILWQLPVWLTFATFAIFVGYVMFVYGNGVVLELGLPFSVSILTLLWFYARYEWVDKIEERDTFNDENQVEPTQQDVDPALEETIVEGKLTP